MRATLTISLPKRLKAQLDAAAKHAGVQRSELVQEAIRSLLVIRRYRELRERMVAHAQARGVHTDDDVAALIS
jgi:metal-responsive CopG/Arc/MetJ family transcriptional regulator